MNNLAHHDGVMTTVDQGSHTCTCETIFIIICQEINTESYKTSSSHVLMILSPIMCLEYYPLMHGFTCIT